MTRIACLLPETSELVPTGALIQLALAHSPRVEDAVTCIYLDAAGLEGLFGAEPEGDAAALAPAPLSLLPLPEELATRLERCGIRTMGELAALPTAGVFERA